jgi:hypothetical protein
LQTDINDSLDLVLAILSNLNLSIFSRAYWTEERRPRNDCLEILSARKSGSLLERAA